MVPPSLSGRTLPIPTLKTRDSRIGQFMTSLFIYEYGSNPPAIQLTSIGSVKGTCWLAEISSAWLTLLGVVQTRHLPTFHPIPYSCLLT